MVDKVVESLRDVVVQSLNSHWRIEKANQAAERGAWLGEELPRDRPLMPLAGLGIWDVADIACDGSDGDGSSVLAFGARDDDTVTYFDLADEAPYLGGEARY